MDIKNVIKNSLKNNNIYLKSFNNDYYFEKNNVILDKTCPQCQKRLIYNKDFCTCGFFLKAAQNAQYWGTFILVWLVILTVLFVCLINLSNFSKSIDFKKNKTGFSSLSPVNIQIIITLKQSPYKDYIQQAYIKSGENNKLIVLIKPTFWSVMGKEKKECFISFAC